MKPQTFKTSLLATIMILLASIPFAAQAGGGSLRPAEQATLRLDRWALELENEASQLKQQTPTADAARGLFHLFSKIVQPVRIVISGCQSSDSAYLIAQANNLENVIDDLENAIQMFDYTNSGGVIAQSTYMQQLDDIMSRSASARQGGGCIRSEIQVIRGGS